MNQLKIGDLLKSQMIVYFEKKSNSLVYVDNQGIGYSGNEVLQEVCNDTELGRDVITNILMIWISKDLKNVN